MLRRRGRRGLTTPKKAAIAAAVLAILVVAGTTALHGAIGSAQHKYPPGAETSSEQTADNDSSEGGGEQAPDAEAKGDASETMQKALESHAWQQDGNSKTTIQFRSGSFVESDGTSAKVTAMSIQKATWGEGGGTLECKLVADGDQTERSSIISLSGEEGSYKVSCDGFLMAKEYVQASGNSTAVSVEGLTEPYTTLIEGKNGDLAKAVASYCRNHVPTATKATFDGEVYLDIPGGRTTATFTCDDTAATVLNVTYSGGSFEVQG
jgi:hypothetical protein